MSKLHFHIREIGAVAIFDLLGKPSDNSVSEVQDLATRMQKNIRRHRLQRVILNMKGVRALDAVAMRKILAACIRPKQSIIYGAAHDLLEIIADNHLPQNIGICANEKEVAERMGTFLFDKDEAKHIVKVYQEGEPHINRGEEIERRRSHRMHVALPLEIKVSSVGEPAIVTTSIATNISESGLFAEYLDLDAAEKMEAIEPLAGRKVQIHIFPSAYFPNEFDVLGVIRRKETRGRQLGIGIEFIA